VFGFSVYESFEGDTVAKTGVLNMPGRHEQLLGGHAVMCVGYNDTTQRFIIRNSWGADWGISGYFTMPYIYMTNTNLADDFWKIDTVTN
jgi:C1A family cysteine protease